MSLRLLLGLVCTGLSISFVWPQVWRVRDGRPVDGISGPSVLQGTLGGAFWVLYGLMRLEPALIGANALMSVANALIIAALVRAGTLRRSTLSGAAVAWIVVAVPLAFLSTAALGWAAILVGATAIVPQVVVAVREADLTGVSLPTFLLLGAAATSWTAYGLLIGDPLVVVPNVVIIPSTLVIVGRTMRFRRFTLAAAGAGGPVILPPQ